MNVSVIVTVLNERDAISWLLDSLAAQSRPPDEVVICDGGSTDGTVEAIRQAAACHEGRLGHVHFFVLPGANISQGRNAAIARAKGPLIASTDAGVRLDRCWLEALTQPWASAQNRIQGPAAVGGFFVADPQSVFETAMGATVLPSVDDVDPTTFLPSSRSVAFLKSTWEAAGGYPEWLDYCEDLVFDYRVNALVRQSPRAFVWQPDATVYFRPRSNLRSFWKQYCRYARGDGKADLWRKRHAIRYVTYLVALPVLLTLTLRGGAGRILGPSGLILGVIFYCWRPWRRLGVVGAELTPTQCLQAVLLVPVIRAVGDLAKMAGYPVGLWWRWRNRRRPEIHWRDGM